MFDKIDGISELCEELLPSDLIQKNIDFDITKNFQKIMAVAVNKCVRENIDGVDKVLLKAIGVSKDEGIYLWGAGKYGIPLAHYLKERNITINGIIDNNVSTRKIDEFDIVSFDKIMDEVKVFITISNKESNIEIERQIQNVHPEALVVKYQDLPEDEINELLQLFKQ